VTGVQTCALPISTLDTYHFERRDIDEAAKKAGIDWDGLMLVECEPIIAETVGDVWDHQLPDGCYIDDVMPEAILQKIRELDQLILDEQPVLSWWPVNKRVVLPQRQEEDAA